MFKLFSKGDQLKIKFANLRFSKIGDGPDFCYLGGLVIRGRDYVTMCSHMVSSLWHIRVLSCNTRHALNPWHQHPLGWAILRLCQVEPTSGRMTNSLWCILDSSSSLNDSVVKIFQVLFFVLLCNVQVLRAKLKELGGNRDKGYDGTQWHPQTER